MLELERIEKEAWEDIAKAAPPAFANAVAMETRPIGAAFYFCCARIPQFQFNWFSGAAAQSAGAELRERPARGFEVAWTFAE